MRRTDKPPSVAVAMLVSMIGFATFAEVAVREEGHWEHYAEERHCKAIGRKAATATTPEETVFLCEGGEIDVHRGTL